MEEFQTLCFEADLCPYRFVHTSLDGEEVELCTDGANVAVTYVFTLTSSRVISLHILKSGLVRCIIRFVVLQMGKSQILRRGHQGATNEGAPM